MNQVSIIIPVHNTPEEYLRECLHSVLRQDYTNWEAILIDDGSTSGAERICDEYAAKDARFCVIHQRQSGVSAARNAGMAAANGDWLIFLDSDDWWEDNLLSSAMKKLAEEPADLLVFNFKTVSQQKTDETAPPAEKKRHAGTSIMEEMQLGLLDETLTTYRVWGMSSFQRFHADLPQQMEQVNQQFLTFGKVHHKGDFYWNAYEVWLMETYIRLLKRYFYHPNNPQSEAEKKRAWKALLTTCPSLKQLRRASWKKMYQSRKSYPLLLFFLLYCRCYALNRRVMEWLLRTDRY